MIWENQLWPGDLLNLRHRMVCELVIDIDFPILSELAFLCKFLVVLEPLGKNTYDLLSTNGSCQQFHTDLVG
jgi:hypothetical protein